MSKLPTVQHRRGARVATALAATLLLAACGGSGQTSSSHRSSAQAPKQTTPSNLAVRVAKKLGISAAAQGAAARAGVIALSDCLKKHGVKVPPQSPSSSQPVFNVKGLDTKAPVFRACLQKATSAYKAQLPKSATGRAAPPLAVTPATHAAAARAGVTTLAGCLEEHGIKVPPQRLSAPQPVFNERGLDTKTAQFQKAYRPCLAKAIAAYEARLRKG